MTSDLDTIPERHTLMRGQSTNASKGICYRCNATWPCDTRVVLDDRDFWQKRAEDLREMLRQHDEACPHRADADRLAEAGRILLSLLEDSLNADAITACGPMRHALRQHEEAERER